MKCGYCGKRGHNQRTCPQKQGAGGLGGGGAGMGEDIDEGGCEVDEGGYEGGGGAQPPVDWSLDRYHRYNVCVYCAKDHQPLFVCDTVQPAEHGGKRYTCPMVFHSECLHALDVAVPADDEGVEWNCPLCSGMAALPDDAALSIHLKTGVKTAAHDCGAVEYCKWGCGAYTWPSEAGKCCHNGAHILTEEFNPPMHPEYRALIASLGLGKVCVNSRFLNGHLAFGTVCHVPNRNHPPSRARPVNRVRRRLQGRPKPPAEQALRRVQGGVSQRCSTRARACACGLSSNILPPTHTAHLQRDHLPCRPREKVRGR